VVDGVPARTLEAMRASRSQYRPVTVCSAIGQVLGTVQRARARSTRSTLRNVVARSPSRLAGE
jgi:hypothetical protein